MFSVRECTVQIPIGLRVSISVKLHDFAFNVDDDDVYVCIYPCISQHFRPHT
jgi:hypothetical protein